MPAAPSRRSALRWAVAAGAALAVPPGVVLASVSKTPSALAAESSGADGVGVAVGSAPLWLDDGDLARELDLVRSTGAGWLRLDVDWSHVERIRGRYDWAVTDRAVDAARARGFRVLGLLTYAPVWAQAEPGSGAHPAPSSGEGVRGFAAFAAAAARRYAGRVDTWEVWNEPNLPQFWSPRPDPAAYSALLRAAVSALRGAAPTATVLSGGLAPGDDVDATVSPVTFVQRMYDEGAAQVVDALAGHPYSYPALPGDVTTATWNTFQRLRWVRAVMLAHGDVAKRVWLTEFGAPTGRGDRAVSPRRQAEILRDGLDRARSQEWIGPLFVYSARDAGTDPGDPEQNFGLARHDFRLKPAFGAVRAAALGAR